MSNQNYVEENGLGASVDEIAYITGISAKNLNRFIEYNENNSNNNKIDNFFGNITL